MPDMKPTEFTAWEFSENEFSQAAILSELQEKHIRTELSYFASAMLRLAVDPGNSNVLFGDIMFNRGAIAALTLILNTSQNAKDNVKAAMEEQIENRKGR